MASVNADKLGRILAMLMSDDPQGEVPEVPEKREEAAEKKEKSPAGKEVSNAEKNGVQSNEEGSEGNSSKEKEEEEKVAPNGGEGDDGNSESDKVVADKPDEQFIANASLSIENELLKHGLQTDSSKELLEFIDYGKLKDEKGVLDADKVTSIVNTIASVSLRKPPSSGKSRSRSNNDGIGKYLD